MGRDVSTGTLDTFWTSVEPVELTVLLLWVVVGALLVRCSLLVSLSSSSLPEEPWFSNRFIGFSFLEWFSSSDSYKYLLL
jgi:hypothetical protein